MDAKDPGPPGCVLADARVVAALDRISYTLFAADTLPLSALADRLARTQRKRFNLVPTCSSSKTASG
jgi:hypothetical protein